MNSITDFGARSDGSDSRLAIQASLDLGGDVYIPEGVFSVGRAGTNYHCLLASIAGTRIHGPGTLRQLAVAASVSLLKVPADRVTVDGITLTAVPQPPDAGHRHGIFSSGARLTVSHVTSSGFTGDGFYLYTSRDARLIDCNGLDNGRNGLSMGAQVDGVTVIGGRYEGNAAQQIDSEPGAGATVNSVVLTGVTLVGGDDYALTISGSGNASRSHSWAVSGCHISGGIFIVWADDVTIAGCVIDGIGPTPRVKVYRECHNIGVTGCTISAPHLTTSTPAVDIVATGAEQAPDWVGITGCTITAPVALRCSGTSSALVTANILKGITVLRTTLPDAPASVSFFSNLSEPPVVVAETGATWASLVV